MYAMVAMATMTVIKNVASMARYQAMEDVIRIAPRKKYMTCQIYIFK